MGERVVRNDEVSGSIPLSSTSLPSVHERMSMTDTPPDRLAIDPASPFHDADLLGRGIGVTFKGGERTDVEEYCISQGWIRVGLGKKVDRKGRPLTIKLSGPIEVRYLDAGAKTDEPATD